MRIGLFGGTFDPPHIGHLIVAQHALTRLGLERVIFIPAAVPPHKQDRDVTPAHLRLAMLRAATAPDERFLVDDLEVQRGGASYTVDTLRVYTTAQPAAELHLMLGADQFEELHTWREFEEVRRLATLVVLPREGRGPVAAEPGVVPLPGVRIDVSASEIRRRIGAGEPIRYLVCPAVESIIRDHDLYRVTE